MPPVLPAHGCAQGDSRGPAHTPLGTRNSSVGLGPACCQGCAGEKQRGDPPLWGLCAAHGHSMGSTWAQKDGAGGNKAEGSPGIEQEHMDCGLVGVISCISCCIEVAPAVGTNPCLGRLEHKERSPPWDRQKPWPWVIAFWGLRAEAPGVGRALGSGWALAEALRLFLFSYKQDRTQSSIKLKNKKRAGRRVGGHRGEGPGCPGHAQTHPP